MIRFGVIGTNWITESFIQGAAMHPDFMLAAVYSRTMEQATQFANKHDIPHLYTDIVEMAISGEIDAVYIASPNSFHAKQAILLMEQGIHVICEKPIAANKKELEAMISAAQSNDVVLMEAMKSTLMPAFQHIVKEVKQIGAVRRYFASYCQYSSRYNAYRSGEVLNAFKPDFANGSLMDIGIYCIYPAVVLFGKPKAVKAAGYLLESGVDGEGSLLLQYDTMDAVIMHSKIANSAVVSEIQGEDGNIVIDKISEPQYLEVRQRDGQVRQIEAVCDKPTMYYEAAEFIQLIKEGRRQSEINSYEASLITMEIMNEARRQIGVLYPSDK
ncbi:Gfo/Idh/MocA family protein [Paenibacillus yanchengensis]|uniref:Gfo/Idh/MocA family protein n=1 Tax=Paenibacillus yanchengensis TaxID=2035833 RepID=A0ABW4YGQ7_9BACL